MDFVHFHLHGILYHEYLERTTQDQRTLYYQHYVLHMLKEGYRNTPESERPGFAQEQAAMSDQERMANLDALIEESLKEQREAYEQEERRNGTRPKRRRVKV